MGERELRRSSPWMIYTLVHVSGTWRICSTPTQWPQCESGELDAGVSHTQNHGDLTRTDWSTVLLVVDCLHLQRKCRTSKPLGCKLELVRTINKSRSSRCNCYSCRVTCSRLCLHKTRLQDVVWVLLAGIHAVNCQAAILVPRDSLLSSAISNSKVVRGDRIFLDHYPEIRPPVVEDVSLRYRLQWDWVIVL
jgi:hypothetical protein